MLQGFIWGLTKADEFLCWEMCSYVKYIKTYDFARTNSDPIIKTYRVKTQVFRSFTLDTKAPPASKHEVMYSSWLLKMAPRWPKIAPK